MAITIIRGYTFSGNDTVTAGKLHQLIEGALISGISAENLAAGSELITISGTAPISPLVGTLWFDATNALFRRWTGAIWKVTEVHVGDSAPTNSLQEGQLWIDTDGATTIFKMYDGSDWVTIGGVVDLTSDVTGVLPEANGGTDQSTYAQGDILYASDADELAKLAKGTDGQVLKIGATIPEWASILADYDSGWFTANVATNYTKAHGLTLSIPGDSLIVQAFWRVSSGATIVIPLNTANSDGTGGHSVSFAYDGTNIYAKATIAWAYYFDAAFAQQTAGNGEVRLLAAKL